LKISVYLRLYDGPAALLLFQQWLWPPQRLSLLHQPVVFFLPQLRLLLPPHGVYVQQRRLVLRTLMQPGQPD
ncbi:hypothetical protein QUH12_31490, partial [Klebsiella pneumoniae]|nr:hypothetical protein [Klebsiella pneumoniae]MDM7115748.1 hypothetical protein [Klebsiella pneumoniae]